jgi:hypothetical protein
MLVHDGNVCSDCFLDAAGQEQVDENELGIDKWTVRDSVSPENKGNISEVDKFKSLSHDERSKIIRLKNIAVTQICKYWAISHFIFSASFEAVYYHLNSNFSEAHRMELIRVLKQWAPFTGCHGFNIAGNQEIHKELFDLQKKG